MDYVHAPVGAPILGDPVVIDTVLTFNKQVGFVDFGGFDMYNRVSLAAGEDSVLCGHSQFIGTSAESFRGFLPRKTDRLSRALFTLKCFDTGL